LRDEGRVGFRERVQTGRCHAREGFWSGSVHADRNGLQLPRHRVELGTESLADDAVSEPRAAINELRYPATGFELSPSTRG
jgi:urease accessory protein